MTEPLPEPDEPEIVYPKTPISAETEAYLSGAYRRILRTAVILSIVALAVGLAINWRSGLGVAVGAILGIVNFIWLHSSTGKLVDRILAESGKPPLLEPAHDPAGDRPKFRFIFPFPLRYLLMIGVAYVILKSYPQLLIGFIVGVVLPVLAAMGEGIYEAVVINRKNPVSQ